MKHPRHGARPGYARAFRRLSRPRPVLLIATALAAAAIPAISIATRSTESSAPDPAPAAQPRMTLQARETGLWSPGDRSGPPVHADRAPLELGTRFTAAEDGWVTGVRFYKARGEKGRHTGSLWDSKGTRLATVTFTNESRSGWQEARFDEAVPVKAGKVYTISYHSEHGTYVGRPSSSPLRSGPLRTAPRRVGVYAYGPSRFPKQWNPKNYNYYVGPIYRWLERRPVPAIHPVPSAAPSDEVAESTPVPSVSPLSPEPVTEPDVEASSSVEPSPVEPSVTPSPAGPSRPTASASPPPVVPSGSGCDGGYPTPACTGVPPSIEPLRQPLNLDGKAYVVTEPGTVLDGVHIPGDLVINADGVTVRNSRIDGTVINERGTRHYSFTISDSTVGPAKGCITAPGVGESHYTATRVLVRGHGDGFRVSGDDVTIRDSYVHLCSNPGDHSDGIQTYMAGKGLVFHHNTVDQRDARDITAPIFITDPNVVDVTLTDNLIMGGTYSIQVKNARGKVVVRGNRLVDRSWVYGPVEADCSSIEWSGNTLVTVDAAYRITSTVGPLPCQT